MNGFAEKRLAVQVELGRLLAKRDGWGSDPSPGVLSGYTFVAGDQLTEWDRTAYRFPDRRPQTDAERLCERALEISREERRNRERRRKSS